jgi:BON domain
MLTDSSLEEAVLDGLDHDPRVPDSNEIAVSANDGMVVLRGSVESFGQRRAAGEDAWKVDGVYEVDNQLKVNLIDADRRETMRFAAWPCRPWSGIPRSRPIPSTSRSSTAGSR